MAKNLITSRKAVFTPSSDILATLRGTRVQITCIDKDGNIIKRVQDDATNETLDDGSLTPSPSPEGEGSAENGGNNGGNSGDNNGGGDGEGNGSDE